MFGNLYKQMLKLNESRIDKNISSYHVCAVVVGHRIRYASANMLGEHAEEAALSRWWEKVS